MPDRGYYSKIGEIEPQALQKSGTERASGRFASISNLCNATLGAGVLSFANAFNSGGYIYTLAATALIGVLLALMIAILSRAAEHRGSVSYQGLVREALGPKAEILASIAMLGSLYGACVSYLIIIGDMLSPVAEDWFDIEIFEKREFLIPVFGVLFCLPLSFLKTMTALAFSSSLAIWALVYTSGVIMYRSLEKISDDGEVGSEVEPIESGTALFEPLPLIIFGFQCHVQAVAIYAEVADPDEGDDELMSPLISRGPGGKAARDPALRLAIRRIREMDIITVVGTLICFLFYATVGLFGYLQFADKEASDGGCTGDDMESNVLNCFAGDDEAINVARIGIALVAIVSYPINHFSARTIINDMIDRSRGIYTLAPTPVSTYQYYLETIAFFLVALAPAMVVDDLGVVFSMLGSTVGVVVILAFPGFLLMDPRGPWAERRKTVADEDDEFMPSGDAEVPLRWRVAGYSLVGLAFAIFALNVVVEHIL